MEKRNTVVIKMITVRDNQNYHYIPIQVLAIRYENGKENEIYDSMIRTDKDLTEVTGLPKYINNEIIQMAPEAEYVARYLKKMIKDSEIIADTHFEQFMLENRIAIAN